MTWALNLSIVGLLTITSYFGEKMNALRLDLPELTIWCSYNTPIAFRFINKRYVSENLWQNTTGKHICEVERLCGLQKKDRMPRADFEAALKKALKEVVPSG